MTDKDIPHILKLPIQTIQLFEMAISCDTIPGAEGNYTSIIMSITYGFVERSHLTML